MIDKTEKQKEAISLMNEKKYVALFGGSRSGKTFILVYGLIIRACKETSRHAIVRSTFNSIKRSIFMDTMPKVLSVCFPDLKVEWNKTDLMCKFPNGSEIWLFGLDKNRADRILGLQFSTIYFNEASELDYSPIQTVISRLAEKNGLKKRVWFDFNPPSQSHWSYYLFIKQLNPVDNEMLENKDEYAHLRINPIDNLDNIDPEYISILEKMPERERTRFLLGEFSQDNEGSVYYAFDYNRHVKSVNKQHGTIFVCQDWNVNPMTAVVMQYINNTFYIFDEIFLENSDTYKMADELTRRGYSGAKCITDSTGRNRKTSGISDHEIMKQKGFEIVPTMNPFVRDRTNNANRLLSDDRIVIDPRCKKLINDLSKVVWKNDKIFDGQDKMLGHISDAATYGFWKIDPIGIVKLSFSEIPR